MVKRLFLRGPLHAYQLGCPWCGFRTLVLQGEGRFTEDGEGETVGAVKPDGPEVRFRYVRLVGSAVLMCVACRVPARVVDGVWVAVDT
jgi:hypothetical protein